MSIEKLAVVGGGAWGTALAQVAAAGGRETLIWAIEDDVVTAINKIHENPVYLKGIKLNKAIRATSNFSDLASVDGWLVVTPAQHMRAVLSRSPCPNMPVILCSKGIEEASGKMLHEVAHDVCPSSPVAVLSGPTFAHEVAAGLPTAVTGLEETSSQPCAPDRLPLRTYLPTTSPGPRRRRVRSPRDAAESKAVHGAKPRRADSRGFPEMTLRVAMGGGAHPWTGGLEKWSDLFSNHAATSL